MADVFGTLLKATTQAMFGNDPSMGTPLGPLARMDAGDFYLDTEGNLRALSNQDFISQNDQGQLFVYQRKPVEGPLDATRRVSSAVMTGVATESVGRLGSIVSKGAKAEEATAAATTAEKAIPAETVVAKTPPAPEPVAAAVSTATPQQRLIGDLEARGTNAFYSTPEQNALRLEVMEKLRKLDATEPIVKETLSRDVNQAILEMLQAGDVHLAPDIKISDQVRDLLQTDAINSETFKAILTKNGVDPVKFLDEVTQGDLGVGMRESATQAARTLQKLSELRKAEMNIRALMGDNSEEVAAFLRQQNNEVGNGAASFIRRVGNLWRGSLVSQLGTAVRNYETSVGRVGMDVFVEGLERGLRTVFANPVRALRGEGPVNEPLTALRNLPGVVTEPFSQLAALMQIAGPSRARRITDAIANVSPKVRQSLFTRYASDVARASGNAGILGKLEKAVDVANFHNKFQDYTIRTAVFASELTQRLAKKGLNLDDIVTRNRIGAIPDEDVRASIEKALETTWSKPLGQDITSQIVRHWDGFVTLGGRIPNMITPFSRFMAEAWRWQMHHSPLGALRLLKPEEARGFLSGDPKQMKVAAQALAGSAALYAAYRVRTSEHAGPNWYEIKLPDGRMVDTRPFAPFSTYLFVADLIKRQQEGTLLGTDAKTLAQGLIGVNFRAGAGLFLVDQLADQLAGVNSADKMGKVVKSYIGNVLSGFAVPFQQFKDAIGQFYQPERVIREQREDQLFGPARSRIPFASQGLPEAESPTRAGPMEREQPLLRQVTGVTLKQAPNPAEAELGRLGFTRREILPSTGDAVLDRLMAKHMGPLTEEVVGAVVQSPGYQKAPSNFAKAEIIRQVLPEIRKIARGQAYAEDQQAQLRLRYKRLPQRQRAFIEDLLRQQQQ